MVVLKVICQRCGKLGKRDTNKTDKENGFVENSVIDPNNEAWEWVYNLCLKCDEIVENSDIEYDRMLDEMEYHKLREVVK